MAATGMDIETGFGADPSSVGMMNCKTACDWCRQRRTAGVTLKQCAGCKVAWYCSKPCQVAAWRLHKIVCNSRKSNTVPPIYATLGHATMAELLYESGIWLQAHRFTLTIVANALVEMRGGVEAALSGPKVVVFKLGPPKNYDGTPATAFTLESWSFNHRDKFGGLSDPQWTGPMVAIREFAAKVFQGVAGADSVMVGMLPVTTYLRDAPESSPQTQFPLCRPRLADGEVVDEPMKATLKNLTMMCAGAINAGIVLRMPEDPTKAIPDMGKIVPEGKKWTWTPRTRSELLSTDGREGGFKLVDEFLRYFDWALCPRPQTPQDCFITYHRLWPYHSISDAAKQVLEVYPELVRR